MMHLNRENHHSQLCRRLRWETLRVLKNQTCITCTAVQMITAELRNECILSRSLIDECRITGFFSGYIVNCVKLVRSTSPEMLVDEELYEVQTWKKSS
ncbi:hypothetical protein TNCV_3575441 [Trichonephila clavipes]|nr:hypothetical protein TNCV_3575441 [Trichonephila clavipes]